ncbi:MAG: hypothetical protein J6L91_07450 [Clostridia bacterium]|nr:hypothetical protein [Clostridia bacterium]
MSEVNTKFVGVFPVYDITFEIDTSGGATTPVWVTVADMESAGLSIDTTVETWNSLTEGGWQRALATAKAFTLSMSGKRSIGDAGNDYVASKTYANGRECDSKMRMTFPNGDTFEGGVVISVTENGGGDSTNVAPLAFDLISNGKPKYTPATTA